MFDWLFHPVKDSKPYWMEFIIPTVTVSVAILGYWWAFKVWKKQKALDAKIAAGQQREVARIAACKAVWGLLAYMSEKENGKTVFVKRGDAATTTWHLRNKQAEEYLMQIEEVFFVQGHGIFMPKHVRDDIYEFRSRVYRLLEKEMHGGGETPELIAVKNLEVIGKVEELRNRLNQQLRDEVLKSPDITI